MVGSAQLRRQGAVLQHGSILLDQPQDLLQELLDTKQETKIRHTNFNEVKGEAVSIEEMENAFTKGFAEAFSTKFEEGKLHEFEEELLGQLLLQYSK